MIQLALPENLDKSYDGMRRKQQHVRGDGRPGSLESIGFKFPHGSKLTVPMPQLNPRVSYQINQVSTLEMSSTITNK